MTQTKFDDDLRQWLLNAERHRLENDPTEQEPVQSLIQSSQQITAAIKNAAQSDPSLLPALITDIYALATSLAKDRLAPAIKTSQHQLIGTASLSFPADLSIHLGDAVPYDVPEAIIEAPKPKPFDSSPQQWASWTTGLSKWLSSRCEAYSTSITAMAQTPQIARYASDQILLNCYATAVAIAAAAAHWGLSTNLQQENDAG